MRVETNYQLLNSQPPTLNLQLSTGLSPSISYWLLRDRHFQLSPRNRWECLFNRNRLATQLQPNADPHRTPQCGYAESPFGMCVKAEHGSHTCGHASPHSREAAYDAGSVSENVALRSNRGAGPPDEARFRHRAQKIAPHRRGACSSKRPHSPNQL